MTSSYEEEKAALLLALDRARANCPTERSDSKPLVEAVQRGAHDTQSIRKRLDNRRGATTLILETDREVIPSYMAVGVLLADPENVLVLTTFKCARHPPQQQLYLCNSARHALKGHVKRKAVCL